MRRIGVAAALLLLAAAVFTALGAAAPGAFGSVGSSSRIVRAWMGVVNICWRVAV